MRKHWKLILGVAIASAAGWVLYKNMVPPELLVYSYNADTGVGTFQWGPGGSGGGIGPGTFTGGWGWEADITPGPQTGQWTVSMRHGRTVKKTVVIDKSGVY